MISVLNFFAEMVINDWKNKPGVRTIYALTMFTFIVSLGGLSIFPHQEPRFLIPLTVPMVLMNAHKLRNFSDSLLRVSVGRDGCLYKEVGL